MNSADPTQDNQQVRPELGTVQQTLLLPLIGRAEFSRRRNFPFSDDLAESLVARLDFSRSRARLTMGEPGMLAMAVRAIKMDRAIREYIYHHPEATVVNIGAGLDTAFWRVDNGRLRWADLDLPDSIELRKHFLPPGDRNIHIAKSMFDLSWIEDLGDVSSGLFIQIPGVLPYIDKETVDRFFAEAAPLLPGAEVIFDAVSSLSSRFVNMAVALSGMKGTEMNWGISRASDLEAWSPRIEVMSHEPYFKDIPRQWTLRPTTHLLMNLNDWWKVGQLFHIRFV